MHETMLVPGIECIAQWPDLRLILLILGDKSGHLASLPIPMCSTTRKHVLVETGQLHACQVRLARDRIAELGENQIYCLDQARPNFSDCTAGRRNLCGIRHRLDWHRTVKPLASAVEQS
jgi:hypothetical protein